MAGIIPASQIDIGRLSILKNKLINDLMSAARGTSTQQPLIYRDVTPQDVNPDATSGLQLAQLSNPNALVANTLLTNQFNTQLQNSVAIGFFGYAAIAPSPAIQLITFQIGTAVVTSQFELGPIYADAQQVTGYFDTPPIFTPQQFLNVGFLASAAVAAGAEPFVLLGYIVEPAGRTVQPLAVA